MGTLISILVVVIIIGALLGGKGFGGVIRRGCGFLFVLLLILVAIVFAGIYYDSRFGDRNNQPFRRDQVNEEKGGTFSAKETCPVYAKPNIESDTLWFLEMGTEVKTEDPDKFNYFYKLKDEKAYVRKTCLVKE
jgi:hypothetical protein